MTDLEMTKLCNEAMGFRAENERGFVEFDPLHDDAQAMALVRRFKLIIGRTIPDNDAWNVWLTIWNDRVSTHADLNRAIVMAVAQMQAAKAAA